MAGPSGRRTEDVLTWEEYFMSVTFLSAKRSKDPVTQVGACIVNADKRIVGVGYNGMPDGCSDDLLLGGKVLRIPWRQRNYTVVCHAEMNAIVNKVQTDIRECKMYVSLYPCNECAKLIIQSGIKEVIYYSDKNRKKDSSQAAHILFEHAGVKLRQYAESQRTKVQLNFEDINVESIVG